MRPFSLSVLFILLLFASLVQASDVRDLLYQFSYDVAKDLSADTFVICDTCPLRPVLKKTPFLPIALSLLSSKLSASQAPVFAIAKVEPVPEIKPAPVVEQPKEVKCSKETTTIQTKLGGMVLFTLGESDLDKVNRGMLDSIVAKVTPGSTVSVYGYTCDIGSDSYNDKLSQERADMVAAYLKTKGLKVDKADGRGKTNPLSTLHKELNRRAEVNIKNMETKNMEDKKE